MPWACRTMYPCHQSPRWETCTSPFEGWSYASHRTILPLPGLSRLLPHALPTEVEPGPSLAAELKEIWGKLHALIAYLLSTAGEDPALLTTFLQFHCFSSFPYPYTVSPLQGKKAFSCIDRARFSRPSRRLHPSLPFYIGSRSCVGLLCAISLCWRRGPFSVKHSIDVLGIERPVLKHVSRKEKEAIIHPIRNCTPFLFFQKSRP